MSRTILFLFLLALLQAPSGLQAQICTPGLINLSSQAEVDAFQEVHGPCDQVSFELNVGGIDITDLQPLSPLAGVDGFFTIIGAHDLASLQCL